MIWQLLLILPAYFANAFPVLIGGELPLDELLHTRLFGKHKSLLGLISGFSAGVIVAGILAIFKGSNYFFLGLLSTIGALVGDLIGSAVKRLLGLKEGSPFVLDNILFALFAILFILAADPGAMSLEVSALLLVVSAVLHKLTNIVAYALKLKAVPW